MFNLLRFPLEPGPYAITVRQPERTLGATLGNPKTTAKCIEGSFTLWSPEVRSFPVTGPEGQQACRLRPLGAQVEEWTFDLFVEFRRLRLAEGVVEEAFFVPRGAWFEGLCGFVLAYQNAGETPVELALEIEGPGQGFDKDRLKVVVIPLPERFAGFEEGEVRFHLPVGERAWVVVAAVTEAQEAALAGSLEHWRALVEGLEAQTNKLLTTTVPVDFPDERIARACVWAKANCLRLLHEFPQGWGMTNNPPTVFVVGRDTAWMAAGLDWLLPEFSAAALRVFGKHQEPSGQIVEYIDMTSGEWEDYGLRLADNTPLWLWAIRHHELVTGDSGYAESLRPEVEKAVRQLLSLRGERGLLTGKPAGTNVWGISSWRNIIPDYVISGEVMEINCLACLAIGQAAALLSSQELAREAQALRKAINDQLWQGDRYLLDVYEGKERALLTIDQVFPVLCGVTDEARSRQLLSLLRGPEFQGPAGLRAVPTNSPEYHPTEAWGLLGGIWPNPMLWAAKAFASLDFDFALGLVSQVADMALDTERFVGTVPGEFPEWLHGEELESRGMSLSPWVAPTFLWAVAEGLLGYQPGSEERASVPEAWQKARFDSIPIL